jgi:hypothetical protein
MAQLGKEFKSHIDTMTDPELLEHERRSLRRLLAAARDPNQFREAADKVAYIVDRLKALAEEEAEIEADR